jgi:hypothetical protein
METVIFRVPDLPAVEIFASLSQMLLGTVVPFVIILGCNIIIIITIKRASVERAIMSATRDQGHVKQKEEHHLTRMLLFVSFAYVVTSLPQRLYLLLLDLPGIGDAYKMDDTYWNLRYQIETFSVTIVWSLNYAINFYLYCIGGGKRYRQDAVEVCKGLVACCFHG